MANAPTDDGIAIQQSSLSLVAGPVKSGRNKRLVGSGFQRMSVRDMQVSEPFSWLKSLAVF